MPLILRSSFHEYSFLLSRHDELMEKWNKAGSFIFVIFMLSKNIFRSRDRDSLQFPMVIEHEMHICVTYLFSGFRVNFNAPAH